VIRGEEWLPSLPLHYKLYESFGWSAEQPQFAHLPLLLKPTGSGKLSKRDGDKFGFPVFPLEWHGPDGERSRGYREDGYFPEAFVNLLALLGWNPGTEQEILSMNELIAQFSLDRVSKSGARFDPEKAKWFNAQYLKEREDSELAELYLPILKLKKITVPFEKLKKIVGLIKERATFVSDFWDLSSYFFVAPESYDEKAVKKFWKGENPGRIGRLRGVLNGVVDFTAERIEPLVHDWIVTNEFPMGQVMNGFRLALVGASMGPNLFTICELLGKEETLCRLTAAEHNLSLQA
jgi:glutamyl-tRNA synthetase